MRFLVDAQLPPALCRWLETRGHQADHVGAILHEEAADRDIVAFAETNKCIVVSKDADFAMIFPPKNYQLVWLQCGNIDNLRLTAWLEQRWPVVATMLEGGESFLQVK
jgi:predicted nuclease of predicted toxin-antitoxin system